MVEDKRKMAKFNWGRIVATPAALEVAEKHSDEADEFLFEYMKRHLRGDYGDLTDEDKEANDLAIKHGEGRVLSAYTVGDDDRLWIITDFFPLGIGDPNNITTILLPSDY